MTEPHPDLFGSYPDAPGWKWTDTSKAAAEAVKPKAAWVRARVMDALTRLGPMTTIQIAKALGLPYETVQPRLSEARAKDEVFDSGERGPSRDPSKTAIVWTLVRPDTSENDVSACEVRE